MKLAIQFTAAEFAKTGLKPLARESYLQEVELIEYRPELRGMRITLNRGGSEQRYGYIKDFIGNFPLERTVSAPAVFAGYGITAPEFNYDDYAGLDAKMEKMEKILKLAYLTGWTFANGENAPRFVAKPIG